MFPDYVTAERIDWFVQNALLEDVGTGDHTSLACVPADQQSKAILKIKDDGIIAGIEMAKAIFNHIDPKHTFTQIKSDGDNISYGETAFEIHGNTRNILKAERLVLNTMQRMSGIATMSNRFAFEVEDLPVIILDTRKTTPGIRAIEKWAVKIGGGENHRFALYDMIMLKDNHIDFAGGIPQAIAKTKQYLSDNNKDLKIIVEARDLDEVQQILNSGGVYRILLDNFDFETTKKAVALIGNQSLTESSGNINEKTIRNYAECGVNYISSGALTHSVYNMDLSLKAI